MPETLTGTNNFSNQIDVPKDNLNEPRSAASLQPAFQKILDNTKNLDVRVAALLTSLNNLVVVNSDDDTAILSAVQAINDHVNDVSAAHALSSISYAGNVAAGLAASDAEVAVDTLATRTKALEDSVGGNNLITQANFVDFSDTVTPATTIAANDTGYAEFTVANVAVGDFVLVSVNFNGLPFIITGRVKAANTVEVVYHNVNNAPAGLPIHTLRVRVFKLAF